ncbi:putative polyketide synthase [Aspergillus bertholletiae]|uniref:Putative polyketide synthase n=1 Tax=Aspergillus bertholletiae TaxID=1226010 RepID=A0A5N7AYL0_9EURO|nr:putative polyketide synthase [Aspergillus bertholletiae]
MSGIHARRSSNGAQDTLAIVGFAFEFPQDATSSDRFWRMLCEGRSANTEFPKDRLNIDAFYHPDKERPSTLPVRGGNFVAKDLGVFDAPFFSITPGEATCMDPQHRRMLETAYHALEDAGIPIERCAGSDTSVYTGCFTNDYLSVLQQDYEAEQRHAAMGIAPSMLANRVSWFFNFKGTSMNLDSACSSSLVALHLACQELRAGTSSMALVGGANLVYHPNFMKAMAGFNFLSPDSRCWSFDSRANGYSRGEGSAMIVVKRLSDALRDGNTIRAVIRNTGSNQDGRTPGITQPSLQSQVELIEHTYSQANLDMGPTRFFEAHGTGTPVGDPVEANAIGQAFRHCRTLDDPLYIGAVKANIGHLEGASGLAGLIKALLVLENGTIPPIAGFESLNPQIDAEKLRLHFPKTAIPWPTTGLRRACVNSFGFGGTNATVILDDVYHYLQVNSLQGYHHTRQFPPSVMAGLNTIYAEISEGSNGDIVSETPKLLVWSAGDKIGTQSLTTAYLEYISQNRSQVTNLAYTLAMRRSQLSWRSFAVYDPSTASAIRDQRSTEPLRTQSDTRVAFVFTGQGSQYVGMGRELLSYPVYKNTIHLLEDDLKQLGCSWSLQHLMDTPDGDVAIDRPEYSQPLITCLQIALIDLLQSLGVRPAVVLGHSSGEIAAAYAAGGLSRFSAVKVAYYRGLLSSKLADAKTGLSMMAVGVSRKDVKSYFDRLFELEGSLDVSVGCVNSPRSVTLTGSTRQLNILCQWFESDSIFARILRVPIAYHSNSMNEIAEAYRSAMSTLEPGNEFTSIAMMSSVTQSIVAAETLPTAEYWVRNLTSTVEFEGALSKLLLQSNKQPRKQLGRSSPIDLRFSHLLEIGPHRTLQGPIAETVRAHAMSHKPSYMALLERKRSAYITLLTTLGQLYSAGYPVDILAANRIEEAHRPMPPNMPSYPFNDTQVYWKESRLSKNFRFRDTARHALLGTRSLDWNPQVAQWRNMIRISELPWLRDHKIDGQFIFPGTAMVVIAVEALRQRPGAMASLSSIEIKDLDFLHAITVPHGMEQVETQFTLITESDASWSRFKLFVMEDSGYVECCRGFIRGNLNQDLENLELPFTTSETFQEWIAGVSEACKSSKEPYDMPTESTVQYGPCFRNLEHMRVGPRGEAIATVNMNTWRSHNASDKWEEVYTIHPCTMDGLAQLIVPALEQGNDSLPTMVPVHASSIWINFREPVLQPEGKMLAAAKCKLRGRRGATANIVGTARDSGELALYIENLETRFVGTNSTTAVENSEPRNLCTRLLWKADVDSLSHEQLLSELRRGRPNEAADAAYQFEILQFAILCFIDTAIQYLEQNTLLSIPPYLHPYVDWMKYQQLRLHSTVSRAATQTLLSNPEARGRLCATVESSGVDGNFFMHIGRNLIPILSGEADPLDVIFRNGLADRYYEQMLANAHHAHPANAYVDLLCFKNPSMKILEVGAGTGGQTMGILETLSSNGVKKCVQYDYTDISPGFFPRAQEKFKEYIDIMQFRVCDISKDPTAQAFELGSYDLVVASHVLHATKSLDQSLQNIKKLLKPGGRLLLFETTDPDALHIGFAFGLLKDWWSPLNNESRSLYSPCLTTTQWDRLLRENGFSGVDVEVPGQETLTCRYSSIIISRSMATVNGVLNETENVVLITDPSVEYQCHVAESIGHHFPVATYTLADVSQIDAGPSTIVVNLVEMQAFVLDGISSDNYSLLQSLMTKTKNLIWVTQPVAKEKVPQHCLAEGLGRTLASEDSTRKFVTLALSSHETSSRAAELIMKLMLQLSKSQVRDLESNYTVSNGVLCIPRVSKHERMNRDVAEMIKPRRQEVRQLNSDTTLYLHAGSPGHSLSLEYREDISSLPPLLEDEVDVRIKAFGLTHRDDLIATAHIDDVDIGTECAGVVHEAGANSGFQPGDRVVVIGIAMARTQVRAKSNSVVAIPSTLSFSEAASLPTALWLAFYSLHHVGRLEEQEAVLIHLASSNFGQIAVQLAALRNARVLTTVRTEAQKEFLYHQLGIPRTNILLIDDALFRNKVHEATDGQGIDVAVGPLADGNLDVSDCLAPCGRVVDVSLSKSAHPMAPKKQSMNICRSSVNMVELLRARPVVAYRIFQDAMKQFFHGQCRPPRSIQTFAAEDIQAAFNNTRDSNIISKRVVEFSDAISLKVNCLKKPPYLFPEDASYVIAGGLGGLGRSFARWMASRGARYLILLSRSGPQSPVARELVHELEQQGVYVATPRVDISNLSEVQAVLSTLSHTTPPIRGCIQATVALRDNLFENMSHDDWTISTNSKAKGSWNLHQALPSNLDFFVLLSSLNGIFGSRAQANYAAGNTFKDALAHYRLARGQKAVSIDLGLMVAEGVVAESEFLLTSMRRLGHLMEIAQDELIALLDYYCNPDLPLLPHDAAQVIVGIEMPAKVIAKGVDLHHSIRRPIFSHLFRMYTQETSKRHNIHAGVASVDRSSKLRNAASHGEAAELVTEWLSAKVSQILGLSPSDIEPGKPIQTYGIDSLVAIDLKNWFETEIGTSMTVFDVMSNTPLCRLSATAAERSRYRC